MRGSYFLFLLALVTYSQNIAPLLDWKCAECHSSPSGLNLTRFPFYTDAGADQPTIVNRILAKVSGNTQAMPPGNRPKLTPSQVSIIQQWLEQGLAP